MVFESPTRESARVLDWRNPGGRPRGWQSETFAHITAATSKPSPEILVLLFLRNPGTARGPFTLALLPASCTGRARSRGCAQLDRVERLADASHWVHHDEAERVNRLLTDFFA
jgi:hypothetical protein